MKIMSVDGRAVWYTLPLWHARWRYPARWEEAVTGGKTLYGMPSCAVRVRQRLKPELNPSLTSVWNTMLSDVSSSHGDVRHGTWQGAAELTWKHRMRGEGDPFRNPGAES